MYYMLRIVAEFRFGTRAAEDPRQMVHKRVELGLLRAVSTGGKNNQITDGPGRFSITNEHAPLAVYKTFEYFFRKFRKFTPSR